MQPRRFNQACFLEVDERSRKVVKEYFFNQGIKLYDNPNKYGVDLISPMGLTMELEHRECFRNDFPYDHINIPQRKEKFLVGHPECSYCVINKDFTKCGICQGERIQLYTEKVWNNSRGDEFFFKIPKEEFLWLRLN